MKLNPIMIAVALCCLNVSAHADDVRRPYIVQLGDRPVASYSGGVSGYVATQPATGQALDLTAPHVQLYGQYLEQQQASVLAAVAGAPVQYQYQLALNGFAAMLTDSEVRQLKARSDVLSISADGPRQLVTGRTPTFLGLDKAGGLWSQLGGQQHAGEDLVIGVVDSGVAPENPAFADRVDTNGVPTYDSKGALAYGAVPAGWRGSCVSGAGFDSSQCNNKLIGAQYFADGFMAAEGRMHWIEYFSARDSIGHGTHTASTSGGNARVAASIEGAAMGAISGIAPRARIAVYKVCWNAIDWKGAPANACYGSDSVAAIEQAIRDGVDAINFSISGGWELDDPVDRAFLNASNAGVFVAAPAGNEGPGHFTLSHIAPWLTTVAATTHDEETVATVTLGNGAQYRGISLNGTALPQTALVLSQDARLPAADLMKAQFCYSKNYEAHVLGTVPQLDPAKVAGKVVACRRGSNALENKSLAVQEAGGVGMILLDDGGGPVPITHTLPTVHVNQADAEKISLYLLKADAPPTAALSAYSKTTSKAPAPQVALFSSRGPNHADMSSLKPDLGAPGVNVLAGVVTDLSQAEHDKVAAGTLLPAPNWAYYSGTSMATPHITGLAVLLRQLHPDWSPAAVKSALMTTASSTLPDSFAGQSNAGTMPWSQGAGQVMPNRAMNPGLVYDIAPADYARYLCNAGILGQCGGGTAPSYNLNLPSITVYGATAVQSVTRRVTNVASSSATWQAKASLPGYQVSVSPSSLTLAAGASASFTLTLKRTVAQDAQWQYGALTWSSASQSVSSPLLAIPGRQVDIPSPVSSEKASSMRALSVYTANAGKLTSTIGGLKPVVRSSHEVAQAPFGSVDTLEQVRQACAAGQTGVTLIPVNVPAKAMTARFELFDRATGGSGNGAAHDLDLVLLDSSGAIHSSSRLQGSNEQITVEAPYPGNYRLCVVGTWIGDNGRTSFDLFSAIVTPDDNGTLKAVLPTRAYDGAYATVGLSWSGLAPGKRYVGALQLTDSAGNVGTTTVAVDTSDPVPVTRLHKQTPNRMQN